MLRLITAWVAGAGHEVVYLNCRAKSYLATAKLT